MATDRELLKAAQRGQVAGITSATDPGGESDATHRRTIKHALNDAATAATAVTETVVQRMARRGFVRSIHLTVPIAVTASDTLFATVNVYKKTGAGAHVLIGTCQTKITAGTGNLTALVPVALTLTATQYAAGDVLTAEVTKASTGTAITAATSVADLSIDVEEN